MRVFDWIRSLFWDEEGWGSEDEDGEVVFRPSPDAGELTAPVRAAGFEALLRIVVHADGAGAPVVTGQLEIPFEASELRRIDRIRDRLTLAEFFEDVTGTEARDAGACPSGARASVAGVRVPGAGPSLVARIDVPAPVAEDLLPAQDRAAGFLLDALEALREAPGAEPAEDAG